MVCVTYKATSKASGIDDLNPKLFNSCTPDEPPATDSLFVHSVCEDC